MAIKPDVETGPDPITPPSDPPCIDAAGSIKVCCGVANGDSYACTLYTANPAQHPDASVCAPIRTFSSNGSLCAVFPAGAGGQRWVQWSDCSNLSSYPTSGAYNFVAVPCPSGDFRALKCCQEPAPAALTLQLEAPLQVGSSTPHTAVNQPVSLVHSPDPNYPCCWFSPPIGSTEAGGNPAYWMLKRTGDDSWLLCLRRVSHELASYQLKSKNGHRFPITVKRGQVSKDFKNWPATITIHAAK